MSNKLEKNLEVNQNMYCNYTVPIDLITIWRVKIWIDLQFFFLIYSTFIYSLIINYYFFSFFDLIYYFLVEEKLATIRLPLKLSAVQSV